MVSNNYQNFTLNKLCLYCMYKKICSQITIRQAFWLQILSNPSRNYDSSFEMLRFINIVHDTICKIFAIFYHSLYAWYHHIMTNPIIFRLHMFFLNLKTIQSHVRGHVSWTKYSKFLFMLWVRLQTEMNNMNITLFY